MHNKEIKVKTREGNGRNEQEINSGFRKKMREFKLIISAIEFPHTTSLYQFPA
jgi:hypothetical protein